MARELAEIDVVSAHRGAIDDPQPQMAAGFDLDHFRIGKGAAIGEKSVILKIIQIRLALHGRHCHARYVHGGGLMCLKIRINLFRQREAEIGELYDYVLPAGYLAAIPDDQRRRKQKLLLKSIMRVHPIGAATAQREIVVGAASRRNCGPGNVRNAILLPRRREAMPVDQARFFDMVFDPDA